MQSNVWQTQINFYELFCDSTLVLIIHEYSREFRYFSRIFKYSQRFFLEYFGYEENVLGVLRNCFRFFYVLKGPTRYSWSFWKLGFFEISWDGQRIQNIFEHISGLFLGVCKLGFSRNLQVNTWAPQLNLGSPRTKILKVK